MSCILTIGNVEANRVLVNGLNEDGPLNKKNLYFSSKVNISSYYIYVDPKHDPKWLQHITKNLSVSMAQFLPINSSHQPAFILFFK